MLLVAELIHTQVFDVSYTENISTTDLNYSCEICMCAAPFELNGSHIFDLNETNVTPV